MGEREEGGGAKKKTAGAGGSRAKQNGNETAEQEVLTGRIRPISADLPTCHCQRC